MYPRTAIVTLANPMGKKIIFGTYNEYLSSKEVAEHISQQWAMDVALSVKAEDILLVAIVPNDGYPYYM